MRQAMAEEEDDEGEIRLKDPNVFRHRKWERRPPYEMSCWGRMLVDPRSKDSGDRKGGVLFWRRLRVPFPLYERILELTRSNEWFSEGYDCARHKSTPLELKILGVLRVLGRGYCFDGIEELYYTSAEINRVFFHKEFFSGCAEGRPKIRKTSHSTGNQVILNHFFLKPAGFLDFALEFSCSA